MEVAACIFIFYFVSCFSGWAQSASTVTILIAVPPNSVTPFHQLGNKMDYLQSQGAGVL
ncbi:hypothetical protein GGTG_12601 [Gaeumannomyces tritici R3-111a-1]|uniref:Uncharacterized protein n=1 Tax=Gaeumannomyces tritici (strain R3-111a-1) TaxID=644352 RepID=J3PGH6_GAET3|nr:hypothetical protein GGTG_12601 [Gaeumannomyces tritici R3-111a-1]EJT69718.1 hypothetical protein GGTG_12601 [Gaeumannomyces tritici R3-111a-1]